MSRRKYPSQVNSMLLAKRYAEAVDFGSPMSAWSPDMLRAYKEANGDKAKAREILKRIKGAQA